jgi:hypothetical protein
MAPPTGGAIATKVDGQNLAIHAALLTALTALTTLPRLLAWLLLAATLLLLAGLLPAATLLLARARVVLLLLVGVLLVGVLLVRVVHYYSSRVDRSCPNVNARNRGKLRRKIGNLRLIGSDPAANSRNFARFVLLLEGHTRLYARSW